MADEQETPVPELTPNADELMVCGVCGRVLDVNVDQRTGRNQYLHSIQDRKDEDHPAIPVEPGTSQDIGRCDFCNVDYPVFTLPVEDFELMLGHFNHGDFAACAGCGKLIRENAWKRLIDRVVGVSPNLAGLPPDIHREAITDLYRRLRKHIIGPIGPLQPLRKARP